MERRSVWTVYEKDFLDESPKVKPSSVWSKGTFNSHYSTDKFRALGFLSQDFPHPKPTDLVAHIIALLRPDEDIVLDFFGGSGTTAHAVINLNRKDDGGRKFILVEI